MSDRDPQPELDAGPEAGPVAHADLDAVRRQLGRPPRGVHEVGHRCGCGLPDVVTTRPRLPDGTPFPTIYYLTCPRAASLIGTLEGTGVMASMQERLAVEPELAEQYAAAHERYLAARGEIEARTGAVPEIAGVSAGGMPTRVKCLHAIAAQSLAQGPGANPVGDETLERLGEWWAAGPCVAVETAAEKAAEPAADRAGSGPPAPRA